MIRRAENRIYLSSLYIGSKEGELVCSRAAFPLSNPDEQTGRRVAQVAAGQAESARSHPFGSQPFDAPWPGLHSSSTDWALEGIP